MWIINTEGALRLPTSRRLLPMIAIPTQSHPIPSHPIHPHIAVKATSPMESLHWRSNLINLINLQWLPMTANDYQWLPMTIINYQWLPMTTNDYPMTIQWLSNDYPMAINQLSRTFDLFFLMIIDLKRSLDWRWFFKSNATFILRWSCSLMSILLPYL